MKMQGVYRLNSDYLRGIVWRIRNNSEVSIQDIFRFGMTYPEVTMKDLTDIIQGNVEPIIGEDGHLFITQGDES